jgi:hypothetical protein
VIISHIIGGLGNQMFQYAAGRSVSLNCEVPLLLDISDFSGYSLHYGFELQRAFGCQIGIASSKDVETVLGWQSSRLVRKFMLRSGISFFRNERFILEPDSHYWDGILNIPCHSYLEGYWLSEKYFQKSIKHIVADFSFKSPMNFNNIDVADHIRRVNSVSLHVRRGDYANTPETLSTQGLCSLDYYRSAIHYISENIDKPVFFIFSDDISWVKNNLKIDFNCRYVEHNRGADSYNDMRLMSLCDHNIIANSTFSWWGAWLNSNLNKLVIAPQAWLANTSHVSDYYRFMDDLIPSNWIRL